MPKPAIDLTGQRFGQLTVLHRVAGTARGAMWACQCACGTTKAIATAKLRDGLAKSCGCAQRRRLTGASEGEGAVG
jgi:hypothetical protein